MEGGISALGQGAQRWDRTAEVDAALARLFGDGVRPLRLAVSTLRGFQGALRAFLEYLTDERYPWAGICEREFGHRPVQVIDERNRIAHVTDFEGDPARRPLSREELMAFFELC